MNSDDVVSTIGNIWQGILPSVLDPDSGYGVVTSGGTMTRPPDDVLDKWEMNTFVIDHKVSEHEILKLKEVAPDYASEIKENIAKNLARDITKKVTFTKKKEVDSDTHHFIGRVWCFTTEELKQLIEDARNV